MTLWQLFVIAGGFFLIIEMLAPAMFFLNFAIAAFLTAIVSVFIADWAWLITVFLVSSTLLLTVFRPFLAKHTNVSNKENETGITGQYIGQIVKAISPITKSSGAVTIYGERWEARLDKDSDLSEIPENTEVKIIKNEGLVLTVEKA